MVGGTNRGQLLSKRKAISALLPYAISLRLDSNQEMVNEILHATTIPYCGRFMWFSMQVTLSTELSTPFLNRAITLASPYTYPRSMRPTIKTRSRSGQRRSRKTSIPAANVHNLTPPRPAHDRADHILGRTQSRYRFCPLFVGECFNVGISSSSLN